LLDDRPERPGFKFKDADLLGMPVRVTLGNAWVKSGLVEIRARGTREERRVPRDQVIATIRELLSS
jgi:prolyl-tRNA synthetase